MVILAWFFIFFNTNVMWLDIIGPNAIVANNVYLFFE